jgi:hypothetical protein
VLVTLLIEVVDAISRSLLLSAEQLVYSAEAKKGAEGGGEEGSFRGT